MTRFQKYLREIGACSPAWDWAGGRTAREAWEECERADWLLWWAWTEHYRAPAESGNDLRKLMAATTIGPRRALRFIPEGEDRPRAAIVAAETWAENPTKENRQAAGAAARAAGAAAGAATRAAWAGAAWARAATRAAWAGAAWHKTLCGLIREVLVLPWQEGWEGRVREEGQANAG